MGDGVTREHITPTIRRMLNNNNESQKKRGIEVNGKKQNGRNMQRDRRVRLDCNRMKIDKPFLMVFYYYFLVSAFLSFVAWSNGLFVLTGLLGDGTKHTMGLERTTPLQRGGAGQLEPAPNFEQQRIGDFLG